MGAALDDGQEKSKDGLSKQPLGPDTAAAVAAEVAAAKARGWLQADIGRYFRSRGVDVLTYKAALNAVPLSPEVYGTLVQVSITGLPDRPATPDPAQIRQHIEWLVEPALGAYDDALIEIAYDGPGRGPTAAKLFGLDELDAAIEFATRQNLQGSNVYLGAGLRLPDADRNHRCSAEDFYVATAVPIDIDQNYDETRALMAAVCDDGLVVATGMTPERRSQHWARLVEPCDNDLEFGAAFAALVAHVGADMKVKDSARIMRLGGTVSYPNEKKIAAGYCTELTTVSVNPTARPSYLHSLVELSPTDAPYERAGDYSHRPNSDGIEYGGKFGTLVTNGREAHFRNLALKHLSAYQQETGADPSVDELWELAFAEFRETADNSDGRWTGQHGQKELRNRVVNTLRRLRLGRLVRAGLYSIETGVGREEAEEVARRREEQWRRPEPHQRQGVAAASRPVAATPFRWVEPSQIAPRDILYGRHLFRKFLSATVSPGGLGKSSLEIVEALAMVTGRNLLGDAPKGKLRVWYWNGEDPLEELQRRIAAACIHYGIAAEDIGDRLFVDSGRDTEIIVARDERNGVVVATPVVDSLVAEAISREIDVLIIDPFVACHLVPENDNGKIEQVVKQWMRVADEGGCAIELVHHVRKPSTGQAETTVDDARGAGSLLAKVRSARVLNAMTKAEADEIGIGQQERWAFFRVDNGKANLVPRSGDALWRRMVGVRLGNRVGAQEDNVGVATSWDKPDAFQGMNENHLNAVRAAVGGGEWREDIRAANWIGQAIAGALGLDLNDQQDKARVKTMIRTWIKTGVLEVVKSFDAQRRERAFVILGKGAE